MSRKVILDKYLLNVSKFNISHKFLGGAAQSCYVNYVKLLKEFYSHQNKLPKDINVLDWGCGKGHISYLLKKEGFNVVSCDLKTSSSDSCFGQSTPILTDHNINVIPLDHPWILPFDDGCFDLVVSFGVLEHVPYDLKSLKEIRRILKNEGILFFAYLPYWLSWTQRLAHLRGNYYHDHLYSKSDILKKAHLSNFSVIDIKHGQLFPKNSLPYIPLVESIDRLFTSYSPFKYFSTNIEGFLKAIK